jgi:hypothetical protein
MSCCKRIWSIINVIPSAAGPGRLFWTLGLPANVRAENYMKMVRVPRNATRARDAWRHRSYLDVRTPA